MSGKTPVSILQEMCIRNGAPPHYELILDGGRTHESLFKYKVFVGEVTATGSGRSKKEAKHDAAKSILKRLQEKGQLSSPEPASNSTLDVDDVLSPYKDILQENAVGQLQELCMLNEISLPEYLLVGDEGPPHAKQFTILCRVSKLEEEAVSRTKKQAKQQAAYKMLKRLKSSLADVLTVSEKGDPPQEKDVDIENSVSTYKELGMTSIANRKILVGQKISEYHLMLKSLKGEILEKLKAEDAELNQQISEDPLNVLKKLLDEQRLDSVFTEVVSWGKHTMLLSISTSPECVVFGIAPTVEGACMEAAINALNLLKLMNK